MIRLRIIKLSGFVARVGAYRVSVGKPEAQRTLERSRYRWQDITMSLQEVGWRTSTRLMWLRRGI